MTDHVIALVQWEGEKLEMLVPMEHRKLQRTHWKLFQRGFFVLLFQYHMIFSVHWKVIFVISLSLPLLCHRVISYRIEYGLLNYQISDTAKSIKR